MNTEELTPMSPVERLILFQRFFYEPRLELVMKRIENGETAWAEEIPQDLLDKTQTRILENRAAYKGLVLQARNRPRMERKRGGNRVQI